jgi:hypothetical protein
MSPGRRRYEDGRVKNAPPSVNRGTYAKLFFAKERNEGWN